MGAFSAKIQAYDGQKDRQNSSFARLLLRSAKFAACVVIFATTNMFWEGPIFGRNSGIRRAKHASFVWL